MYGISSHLFGSLSPAAVLAYANDVAECIAMLLALGVDINQPDVDGAPPLFYPLKLVGDHSNAIVKQLLDAGAAVAGVTLLSGTSLVDQAEEGLNDDEADDEQLAALHKEQVDMIRKAAAEQWLRVLFGRATQIVALLAVLWAFAWYRFVIKMALRLRKRAEDAVARFVARVRALDGRVNNAGIGDEAPAGAGPAPPPEVERRRAPPAAPPLAPSAPSASPKLGARKRPLPTSGGAQRAEIDAAPPLAAARDGFKPAASHAAPQPPSRVQSERGADLSSSPQARAAAAAPPPPAASERSNADKSPAAEAGAPAAAVAVASAAPAAHPPQKEDGAVESQQRAAVDAAIAAAASAVAEVARRARDAKEASEAAAAAAAAEIARLKAAAKAAAKEKKKQAEEAARAGGRATGGRGG